MVEDATRERGGKASRAPEGAASPSPLDSERSVLRAWEEE